MTSFFKKSLSYLISNIINGLSLLFLLPFLTRFLSSQEYSQVVLLQTFIFGLLSFIHLNIFQASNIKYFDLSITDEEKRRYNTGCIIILLLSISIFLFILLFNLPLLSKLSSLSKSWLICASIIAISQTFIQFCLWQWQMRKKAYQYSIYNSSYIIISSLLTLILLYILHDKINARIYALLSISVIFFYSQYILLYCKNGCHFH